MRTRFVVPVLLVVAVGLVAAGAWWSRPGPSLDRQPFAQARAEYPDDLLALGLKMEDASPDGKLSKDAAIDVAMKEHGQEFAGAEINAYLVNLSDDSASIRDRVVWIVRFSGFETPIYGPIAPGQSQGAYGGTVQYAYVYVDASTGEWILTRVEG